MKVTLDNMDFKRLSKLIKSVENISGGHDDDVKKGEVSEYPIKIKWEYAFEKGMTYNIEIEKEELNK